MHTNNINAESLRWLNVKMPLLKVLWNYHGTGMVSNGSPGVLFCIVYLYYCFLHYHMVAQGCHLFYNCWHLMSKWFILLQFWFDVNRFKVESPVFSIRGHCNLFVLCIWDKTALMLPRFPLLWYEELQIYSRVNNLTPRCTSHKIALIIPIFIVSFTRMSGLKIDMSYGWRGLTNKTQVF